MKKLIVLLIIAATIGCMPNSTNDQGKEPVKVEKKAADKKVEKKVDDGKGVGQTTHVDLANPLDASMIETGKTIYDMKCSACHKLTDKRVVGPGWAGLTKTRKPEWIMNMITDVEMMLAEDSLANALFEQCLVRMPNQNVTLAEARSILEFMRSNDGEE